MYVIFESFIVAIILWIAESIVFAYVLRKKSWKVHVLVQIVLLLMIWPTSQLAFNVIYYKDTKDIKAKSVEALGLTTNIPVKCKEIIYHQDPTGRWFYCAIPSDSAINWLEQENFKSTDVSYYGSSDQYPQEVKNMLNQKVSYFATDTKPNGAGSIVILSNNHMFFRQWYW